MSDIYLCKYCSKVCRTATEQYVHHICCRTSGTDASLIPFSIMPTIAAIIDEYNADIKQQLAEARAANERRDAIVAAATAFAAKWNDKESQGLLESFCGLMSALQD